MSRRNPIDWVPVVERVQGHSKRRREAGLSRVSVWVPRERIKEVHEFAFALRAEDGKLLPQDKKEKISEQKNESRKTKPEKSSQELTEPFEQDTVVETKPPKRKYTKEEAEALVSIAQRSGVVELAPEIQEALKEDTVVDSPIAKRDTRKVGRNEPCPCGSGKKYKKCCVKDKGRFF